MSNELTTQQSKWLQQHGINESVWHALTTSIHPGADPRSVVMYLEYCRARELDPMKKPAHIVPMPVTDARTGEKKWRDVIMPGIAEARITASRTGQYAGQAAPEFGPVRTFDFGGEPIEAPEFCTVTVFRLARGVGQVAYSHTEYFEEAAQTTKDGRVNAMWRKRRRGQLAKVAEAGALRKAFPEELGGENFMEEAPSVVGTQATEKPSSVSLDALIAPAEKPEEPPEEPPQDADPATVLQYLGRAEAEGDADLLDEAVDLAQRVADEHTRSILMSHAHRIAEKVGSDVA